MRFDRVNTDAPLMKKIILILTVLLLIAFSTFATLYYFAPKPPMATLEKCHRDIGAAHDAEAQKYAADLLAEAEVFYEEAKKAFQEQNQKIYFLRDYSGVLHLVSKSTAKAEDAIKKTADAKANLKVDIKKKLDSVNHKIEHFQTYYAHLPLNARARKDFTNAKLKYLESQQAFERKAYLVVGNNLDEANRLISKSVKAAHQHLSDYFDDLPKWKRWYNETVEWTIKNKSTAIIVDKFAHKTYVYKNGKVLKEYTAEMGPNWIGTKLYRGDKATPEGKYHVTKKKSGSNTIYYKAFLINYPNDDDKARYKSNVQSGKIPARGIGNLIEVHGGGGKGVNWTDGCVALTNEDMDKIWGLVSVGTPVTIVGSMRSLQEINGQ